jgi:glycosyltransferase involved in cell wall biosynthesis
LNRSLSVLLPVHNAQSSLASKVEEILELLPELTERFELLITDDASTDGTWEAACELARRYPQVRLLREPVRRGAEHAVRQSNSIARGEAVIAHDGEPGIDVRAISRLWRSITSRGDRIEDDGFRLLRPAVMAELRQTAAAVKKGALKGSPYTSPQPPQTSHAEAPERKARRPNYLSRARGRTRDVAAE